MNLINLILLIIIILLILISGFLSGSETAVTATSKARIVSKIKKGSLKAQYVKKIIDQKDRVISSILLSNNIVNWDFEMKDPGFFTLPETGRIFRGWRKGGHGKVNMHKAFLVSSNTYFFSTLSAADGTNEIGELRSQCIT